MDTTPLDPFATPPDPADPAYDPDDDPVTDPAIDPDADPVLPDEDDTYPSDPSDI